MQKTPIRQEIIFVTGKGGVGKSAVAAAIALKKSQSKRTLLVELGSQSFYKDYFRLPSLGFDPQNIKDNLDLALWSGTECLKEYARYLLKVESLYRLFFENSVTRSLINIAPGLAELAIMGKATSHPRKVGPVLNYDCLVIDVGEFAHLVEIKLLATLIPTARLGVVIDGSSVTPCKATSPKLYLLRLVEGGYQFGFFLMHVLFELLPKIIKRLNGCQPDERLTKTAGLLVDKFFDHAKPNTNRTRTAIAFVCIMPVHLGGRIRLWIIGFRDADPVSPNRWEILVYQTVYCAKIERSLEMFFTAHHRMTGTTAWTVVVLDINENELPLWMGNQAVIFDLLTLIS
jgi:hypothetical protein